MGHKQEDMNVRRGPMGRRRLDGGGSEIKKGRDGE